jgi:hypothetical protein
MVGYLLVRGGARNCQPVATQRHRETAPFLVVLIASLISDTPPGCPVYPQRQSKARLARPSPNTGRILNGERSHKICPSRLFTWKTEIGRG